MSKEILIQDLVSRTGLQDDDLMIVEDDVDTKKTTFKELKRSLNANKDNKDSSFYTMQEIDQLITGINVQLSGLVGVEQFNDLSQQIKNIVGSAGDGTKDTELVAARGEYDTLSERLSADTKALESKYIQFPKANYYASNIDLSNYNSLKVRITAVPYEADTTIQISSKNKLKIVENAGIAQVTDAEGPYYPVQSIDSGYIITYTKARNIFNIPIGNTLKAGTYYFYCTPKFSNKTIEDGMTLKLIHTDGTSTSVEFTPYTITQFTITKSSNSFQIIPNTELIEEKTTLTLTSLMISEDCDLKEYYPCTDNTIQVKANQNTGLITTLHNSKITRTAGLMNLEVLDTSFTGDYIRDQLEILKHYTTDPEDYCGLLEERGTYIYAAGNITADNNSCTTVVDSSKMRNNHSSVKITIPEYDEFVPPQFTLRPPMGLNLSNSRYVSLQLYIDRTLSERFATNDGIRVMISSDAVISNPPTNYYYFNIGADSFLQGWNTIKLRLDKFKKIGTPNLSNVNQICFRVYSSNFTNGKSFYLNSIIIDQIMKPTVLFAFDDFSQTGFEYQFPYLYSRGIPATIFGNNKQTLTKDYMNKISQLHYEYGWDISNYGCNPEKEIMVEDDNSREQYMAVKETRQWIYDNFTSKVISYAAPFGNLRPISEPVLKEMGFKIAKTDADAYCSFFSKEDFAIPMQLLSNAAGHGSDAINAMIDEIVETGQTLCIYTADVTGYGTDIASNKTSFENVIAHILKYVNQGRLQCMTFSEFYEKCTTR